ncbi:ATP-binding protein [Actinomadura parmotrematis]|uniref:ATP-binding protein n=1 Tax=Actinomadura parmotrematis TaxID=2864039 RepID=A0ABS7FUH9_9ACTN|nr:ATP-binding protein [Actinomadura parmotrematis]MBW8484053.1 ATP-binding protein [Actinomadura parmotrematis]
MNENERRALRLISAGLDWAATSEHAWRSSPFHVDGLHDRAEQLILDGIADTKASSGASPLGLVLQGEGGVGKTHLLGWARQRVEREGGYFFLADFSVGGGFWTLVGRSMIEDLGRSTGPRDGGSADSQISALMRRLAAVAGLDERTSAAVSAGTARTRGDLDALVAGLLAHDRRTAAACADTVRALALYASLDPELMRIGDDYLKLAEEMRPGERQEWGLSRRAKTAQDIVMELSMVLACTGPSVIAVDQVDALLDHGPEEPGPDGRIDPLQEVANGLMALRHTTRRTLCVVACLPSSWQRVRQRAVGTVPDRFRTSLVLNTVPDAVTARALVERRFAAALGGSGLPLPDQVWPVAPGAFATAPGHTPRVLLQQIYTHVEDCRRNDAVRLLERFDEEPEPADPISSASPPTPAVAPPDSLAALDARFAELRERSESAAAFDAKTEDETVPPLLAAGLNAWIVETGLPAFTVDPPPGRLPELHARLRQTVDARTEQQRHWAFRAVGATHPRAALTRLANARAAAGIGADVEDRTLVMLRNAPWSSGDVTRQHLQQLAEGNGVSLPLTGEDVRVFAALRVMFDEQHADMNEWLKARRPAGRTELLGAVLGELAPPPPPPPAPENAPPPAEHEDGIRVGTRIGTDRDVELDPAVLTRHTAIFAGSGSGKTVLIRRLVEECALRGVSSIVLDPNNDLSRLGDAWPSPPRGWGDGDAARAERYLAGTEVVVWTPGLAAGRPLTFQPLPDFAAVRGDADGLNAALDIAVATLAVPAGVGAATRKANLGKAVLREALGLFARGGGGDFAAFLALLAELPFEASRIDKSDQIAADLGQALTAATINDPLFAGAGEPVAPETLLTPSPGKRARVSVISFVGLADDRRPGFVSRLQMALFSWVRRNPATGKALSGLYVMDEAQTLAPAVAKAESTESTLTLASQARKYGLGLVFATQAPKALHNQIAGNATTQFIGRLQSPATIEAAQTMARARGGDAARIGQLKQGQFYVTTEGLSEALVQTPLCFSHHPAGPLTEEEIVQRARGGVG